MSGILNIGTRALLANQAALQTAGNNIANVNTPGYSRQEVLLQNVKGQFSGSGYYGAGVDIVTVQRVHNEFLTRQAALASAVAASDTTRFEQLRQLEDVFKGGPNGLGAAVSDFFNAFSDVASSPADQTSRAVVLARADEAASSFRAGASQLQELQRGVVLQLRDSVAAINNLARGIAEVNQEIARAKGVGHDPNDLLDHREQLIRDLNQYVQTSQIEADDGTVGIFLAGSQPLVLGQTASALQLTDGDFSDPATQKLQIQRGGVSVTLDEATLGGGSVSGLLRYHNTDLVDASNLLGRMALAIGTKVNEQQALGLDLNGAIGAPLFNLGSIPAGYGASTNTGTASVTTNVSVLPISGATALVASNYEVRFNAGGAIDVVRLSDGQLTSIPGPGPTTLIQIDGLDLNLAGVAAVGDRFLVTPYAAVADSFTTAFSSPRALAVASPVAAGLGAANTGTLVVERLAAKSNPPPAAVTITFTGPGTFTRSDTGATVYAYTPSQPIEYDLVPPATTGWAVTLKGTPQVGDTLSIGPNPYPLLSGGNAEAMLALRDVPMFDGAPLTDGYASLMSQVGIRVQGAQFAAEVSTSIADNIERDRTAVAGVNLDEEAAKLLQFQQSYQAAAKMMQVAQNMFDTLMQGLGR
ncbi:MAG: flagellar hook-associated protein FlgK [Rhodoferax sp.]|nr:flagellar hook-associated protein FlgK [Rhodoferax sp.]MBK9235754.1 flagellar hook-associated protein FlgK [Rhodoferax sp.]